MTDKATDKQRVGFTLVELLVVIAIIGLLISLILVAAADGVRRAEERATQALITKLETALNDRVDSLLNSQPPVNQTHRFLAAINAPNALFNGAYLPIGSASNNSDDRRAQVIAQFDFLRAELPDVFFLNSQTSDGSSLASSYPLNFAASPYPAGTNSLTSSFTNNMDGGSYVLPLGNNYPGLPLSLDTNNKPYMSITTPLATTGMFGASFSAAGGIYKNMGYGPKGYDGVDNNGNGLIDDYPEGIAGLTPDAITLLNQHISNHKHKTARSEMLYAILVEGLSPLGSAFGRDDFTAREVQDTDGDGCPEFVDAWGEPLQFYRWPIYYGGVGSPAQPNQFPLGTSDSQLGSTFYTGPGQTREQDPLDTNQLLVGPGWWSSSANPSLTLGQFTFTPPNSSANPGTNQSSYGAVAFMNYFHSLVEPLGASTNGTGWDRSGYYTRREFFTKFLILSGGPDHEPGVAQFAKDYYPLVNSAGTAPSITSPHIFNFPDNTQTMEWNAQRLLYIENQASVSDPLSRGGSFLEYPDPNLASGNTATVFLYSLANSDDITNHNISGVSTGVR